MHLDCYVYCVCFCQGIISTRDSILWSYPVLIQHFSTECQLQLWFQKCSTSGWLCVCVRCSEEIISTERFYLVVIPVLIQRFLIERQFQLWFKKCDTSGWLRVCVCCSKEIISTERFYLMVMPCFNSAFLKVDMKIFILWYESTGKAEKKTVDLFLISFLVPEILTFKEV